MRKVVPDNSRWISWRAFWGIEISIILVSSREWCRVVLWMQLCFTQTNCVRERKCISWAPNRECVLNYLGEHKFEVERVLNSKLAVGDTFVCAQFFQKELLIVSDLVRGGKVMGTYAMGKQGGVTWIKL